MAITNLNIAPYYDDYDPAKDYLRVLFRPGRPVQARELTTLQTMLQQQIERFGNHIFQDGSRVSGASINVNTEAIQVNLVAQGNADYPISGRTEILARLEQFVGLVVTDATDTIKAKVLRLPNGVNGVSQTGPIYIQYISGNTFEAPQFQVDPITQGYLFARQQDNPSLTADIFNVFSSTSPCTLANIQEGVYYVGGEFIRVAEQTIVVSNSTNKATAALGFTLSPSFITANEDPSLYDNARNSPNEGAPGADRLSANLAFSVRSVDDNDDPSFYRIVVITNGVIQVNKTANPQYAELLDTLARRTYDESGHYALAPFYPSVKEGTVENQFIFSLDASKAYVKGYEIQTLSNTDLSIDRGLDSRRFGGPSTWTPNSAPLNVSVPGPSYVRLSSYSGSLPGFTNGTYNQAANILTLVGASGPIGTARAWGYDDTHSYLYLYDINLNQNLVILNASLSVGNDVTDVNGTTGFVYSVGGATNFTITGASTQMAPGPLTTTSGASQGGVATILSATTPNADIVSITGPGFSGFVAEAAINNGSTPLFYSTGVTMKTALDTAGEVVNNNLFALGYNVQAGTGALPDPNPAWTNNANGGANGVKSYIFGDTPSIAKTLKFSALRIRNTGVDSDGYRRRQNVNYGWSAIDEDISLFYSDIQTVYRVVRGTQNFASDSDKAINAPHVTPKFDRINLVIGSKSPPAGYILTGQTTGAKAIVAVTDATVATTSKIGLIGWHEEIGGTGIAGQFDVVYLTPDRFTDSESIIATQQSDDVNNPNYQFTNIRFAGVVYNGDNDATSNYLIDNGQRDEYYDTGRLVRKDGTPAPMSGDLLVFFSYFDVPDTTGGFYNVDSYASSGFFDNDVRYYYAPQDIVTLDPMAGLNLRDYVDMRQRVMRNWSYTENSFAINWRDYQSQTHVTPATAFAFSGEEYLGRIDAITLDRAGVFRNVKGAASYTPVRPPIDDEVMTLNYVTIPPAVRYATKQVTHITVDNRRFTMRDIGNIESRVNNLERSIALNRLEIQALTDQFVSTTGASVFKLGYLTDDFTQPDLDDGKVNTGLIRDFTNPAHNTKVDITTQSMRADATDASVTMVPSPDLLTNPTSFGLDPYYLNRNADGTLADGRRGSFFVKRYTESLYLNQPLASSTYRINPYATWVYNGQLVLSPKQDFWKDDPIYVDSTTRVTLPTRPVVVGGTTVTTNSTVTATTQGSLTSALNSNTFVGWLVIGGGQTINNNAVYIFATQGGASMTANAITSTNANLTTITPPSTDARSYRAYTRGTLAYQTSATLQFTGQAQPSQYQVSVYNLSVATTTVSGGRVDNVVDANELQQYGDVLSLTRGKPFNSTEVAWTGRTLLSDTSASSGESQGRVTSFSGGGARSRNYLSTGVKTTITGTQFTGTQLRALPKTVASSKVVFPEMQSTFMRDWQRMKQNPQGGINFDVTQMRPDVTLKATFDNVDVTRFCRQYDAAGNLGAYGVLRTDNEGVLKGNFAIPGNTFNVGTRKLFLTDLDGSFTTMASATFTAAGTDPATIERNFLDFSGIPNFVAGASSQGNTTERTRELYDPIAQTFTLPLADGDPGSAEVANDPNANIGAFITSVDVYFAYVDTRPLNNWVNLQIRNVVNGYPGPVVLGRGVVDFTVNSAPATTSTGAIAGSANGSVATRIRLNDPCWLAKDTEYCLVLLSPSDQTSVFVAAQGEADLITGGLITKQPNVGGYYGSFFTSQNNSTWNADQNRDLKFGVYRAVFNTGASTIRLVDRPSNYIASVGAVPERRGNALETFDNCDLIRVYYPNHGMYAHNLFNVTVSGVEPTVMDSNNTFNGIPLSLINGQTFNVLYPTMHTFFIRVGTLINGVNTFNADLVQQGTGGGANVLVSQCFQYDALKTNLQAINFANTDVSMTMRTVTGYSLDISSADDKLVYNPTNPISGGFGQANTVTCIVDEYCEFEKPQIIFNGVNRGLNNEAYSVVANISLNSSVNTLSPVIKYDATTLFNAYRNNIAFTLSDSEIATQLNSDPLADAAPYNLDKQNQFASYQSAIQMLTEDSAYITKQVDLLGTGNGVAIMFDADMEPGSSIEFAYKVRAPGVNTPFNELNWVNFPINQFVTEANYGMFASEAIYNTYTAMAETPDYSSFQVRLRLRSPNEAQTPRIRNLRITAVMM